MLLSDHHRYHQRQRLRRNLCAIVEWSTTILALVALALGTAVLAQTFGFVVHLVP